MSITRSSAQPSNPFLEGNFAPVSEEHEAEGLAVEGELPRGLRGRFLRIGPNPQFVPEVARYHWFDGDGMVHGVGFEGGQASYRNRWVRTVGFDLEREKGDWIWRGVNGPPDFGNPHGAFKNVANTAFVEHNDRLLALWEGGNPHEIDAESLATRGEFDFAGALAHPLTAHPKVDPRTGELMTFGYMVVGPPFCHYSVFDAAGALQHSTVIDIPRAVMLHDFAITEHYTVFFDMPVTFSLDRAMAGGPAFGWEPQHGSRIGVLARHAEGSAIRWFEVATCSVIHTASAYEDGDNLVIDAPRFESQSVFGENDASADTAEELARMHRWTLNLKTGAVVETADASGLSVEFPRVDERRLGRKIRYVYAGRQCEGGSSVRFDGVVKFDRDRDEAQLYHYAKGVYGGEAVFAPNPSGQDEDDGWLLVHTHDEGSVKSQCLILDARQIETGPIAKVEIPWRVPYGFHTGWVAR